MVAENVALAVPFPTDTVEKRFLAGLIFLGSQCQCQGDGGFGIIAVMSRGPVAETEVFVGGELGSEFAPVFLFFQIDDNVIVIVQIVLWYIRRAVRQDELVNEVVIHEQVLGGPGSNPGDMISPEVFQQAGAAEDIAKTDMRRNIMIAGFRVAVLDD